MQEGIVQHNITIILNRPKYAGNIGSVARCMKNMGIETLYVVCRERPDEEEMYKMATHVAKDIIAGIRYFDELGDAVAGCTYIVATSARLGSRSARQHIVEPREMALELVDLSRNNDVALIFGPEDRGLTNEELKYCQLLVNIPTTGELKSLNLSHAVMVCCYELFLARRGELARFTPRLACSEELESMYDHLKEMFTTIGFINHENPEYWMMHVRRIFSRIRLYSKEVRMIRGICRHVLRYARQQKA
jgi:tRNA/rRNA methyltransferase